MLVVCNFTPVPRHGYRMGVPQGGVWRECLNTDSRHYGGSGMGNLGAVQAEAVPAHGLPMSLGLTLPPLSVLWLEPEVGRMTPDAAARLPAGPALAAGCDADDVAGTAGCEPGRLLASRHRGALVPVRCGHRRRDRSACRCRNAPTASGTASCPAWPWDNCTDCAPSGPWQPAAGHRFNAAKLLIDPYARELIGGANDLSNEVAFGAGCIGPGATRPA